MIKCEDFFAAIKDFGIGFFTGVPDSTLKDFCAYVNDTVGERDHVIAANEGGAVALASGHYLASGKPALVYMQNSGLGNSVNPLVSLTDPLVYGIPVLLLVGWRGAPGVKDEPQHAKQGIVTLELLKTLGVEHAVLPDTLDDAIRVLHEAKATMDRGEAFAIVVRPDTFEPYQAKQKKETDGMLSREDAIRRIAGLIGINGIIVSSTGKISRELYEYRDSQKETHAGDFLTVGSMGHCSQIALGIALANPGRDVYCLDGDGAAIMHLGALAIIGSLKPPRFRHVILNNGAHESVGGQPTAGFDIDFTGIAKACGYRQAYCVKDEKELVAILPRFAHEAGPSLLEIVVRTGARKDLGRPAHTPKEIKRMFMENLK